MVLGALGQSHGLPWPKELRRHWKRHCRHSEQEAHEKEQIRAVHYSPREESHHLYESPKGTLQVVPMGCKPSPDCGPRFRICDLLSKLFFRLLCILQQLLHLVSHHNESFLVILRVEARHCKRRRSQEDRGGKESRNATGWYVWKRLEPKWLRHPSINPSEKYAPQIGFIFPEDRGENLKNLWNQPTYHEPPKPTIFRGFLGWIPLGF